MKSRLLFALMILFVTSCLAAPTAPSIPLRTSTSTAIPFVSPTTPAQSAPTETPLPVSIWPTSGWKTSTPEEQGMDSDRLAEMIETILEKNSNVHSLLIVRHGFLVAEVYFDPNQADILHEQMSVTKSVVSDLLGIALQKGAIENIDQKMLDFFSDRSIDNIDGRKGKITLKDLLTMTSGLEWKDGAPSSGEDMSKMVASPDWVQHVLDRPMVWEPGSTFNYNSGSTHLLSAIIQQATGMSTSEFAQKYLFDPLGITNSIWESDPQGITSGGWGLWLTPRDMAKLGYLYLHGGIWDEQTIIPPDWVEASTASHTTGMFGQKYGYLWWVLPDGSGYYAAGYGGQNIFVFPDQDMVVVTTAGLSDPQLGLPQQLISTYIFPAIKSANSLTANPSGVIHLQAAIDHAAHPAPQPVPPQPEEAQKIAGNTFLVESNPSDLRSIALTFEDGKIDNIMEIGGQRLELEAGLDGVFRISSTPLGVFAAKGFWQDDKTLVIILQILGQAERDEWELTFDGNTVTITDQKLLEGNSSIMHGNMQK